MKPVLYDYWRSSASYRVRIALNLKGVAYHRVAVSLLDGDQRSPEHLARNPQGFVPALDVGNGTVLTQSLAIIDWLDQMVPLPALLPADPVARAQVLAQVMVIAADIHPIDNLRVLRRLESHFGADQAARDDWYGHWIKLGFDALEAMAAELPGPMLGGDTPNLADIFLVPQMANARRVNLDMAPYPRLAAADAAASVHPAFAAAHPDNFKP